MLVPFIVAGGMSALNFIFGVSFERVPLLELCFWNSEGVE